MILKELKLYLDKEGPLSINQLCDKFSLTENMVKDMLFVYVRKEKVIPIHDHKKGLIIYKALNELDIPIKVNIIDK